MYCNTHMSICLKLNTNNHNYNCDISGVMMSIVRWFWPMMNLFQHFSLQTRCEFISILHSTKVNPKNYFMNGSIAK